MQKIDLDYNIWAKVSVKFTKLPLGDGGYSCNSLRCNLMALLHLMICLETGENAKNQFLTLILNEVNPNPKDAIFTNCKFPMTNK